MEQDTGFPMGMANEDAYNYAHWQEELERERQQEQADRHATVLFLLRMYPDMTIEEAYEKMHDTEFLLAALAKGESDDQAAD